ncbi:MAG: TolC family protein [Gammaproteobacteria bacterium]|nr:TolC family protein [Gammaproteobacteria bacterium]
MNALLKPFSFVVLSFFMASTISAQSMTLEQVLQQVMDHYPSLKTAALQVQRAQQESLKVESQLGWQLGAQAGISHDLSLFGTPTDSLDLGGSISRSLESGGRLGFNANISRDDADASLSPQLPNPATSTSVDVTYTLPLAKGSDNPLYTEGLASAQAGEQLADAERLAMYDQLATQVIDVFLAAAITRVRIKNIDKTIERTERLKKYIKDQYSLGLTEDKDVLQIEARLKNNQAEKRGLQVAWQQQKISLNRLMGRAWNAELLPEINLVNTDNNDFEFLFEESKHHSPSLNRIKSRLKLADSAIKTARDARQDNLDLVMFLGNKTNAGDTTSGDVDESEVVGGIRLEFSQGLDKSGYDAELYQAQMDRSIALQDQLQILEDLKYDLSSLLAEINAARDALDAYTTSINSEQKKLDEALERYQVGRAGTDDIIQYESELSIAELSFDLQKMELARRLRKLNLLRGQLWKNIRLPEYQLPELELTGKEK